MLATEPSHRNGSAQTTSAPNGGGAPIVEAARLEGPASIATLAAIRDDVAAPAAARIAAVGMLLDRGFGNPAQPADLHMTVRRIEDMTEEELEWLVAPSEATATGEPSQ